MGRQRSGLKRTPAPHKLVSSWFSAAPPASHPKALFGHLRLGYLWCVVRSLVRLAPLNEGPTEGDAMRPFSFTHKTAPHSRCLWAQSNSRTCVLSAMGKVRVEHMGMAAALILTIRLARQADCIYSVGIRQEQMDWGMGEREEQGKRASERGTTSLTPLHPRPSKLRARGAGRCAPHAGRTSNARAPGVLSCKARGLRGRFDQRSAEEVAL